MRKLLLFLVTSTLLMSFSVISTEKGFEVTNEQNFQLNRPAYSVFYDRLPKNPNVYEPIERFEDKNLSSKVGQIEPNQVIEIEAILANEQGQSVFKLKDQTYILASQSSVFEDFILTQSPQEQTFWLRDNFTLWTSPIGNQAKKVATKKSAYTKVTTTETATTPRGTFVKLDEGWINIDELSLEDNRMEKVQKMLLEKHNQSHYGIYVYQLETGKSAGLNQDKMMYTASVAKLPVLYYAQLQLDQGKIKLEDRLKYIKEVNEFSGTYQASGSGNLPKKSNDKDYSVDELIQLTAKKSDNIASNILTYYITSQFDSTYYETLDAITQQKWEMDEKNGTAQMAGQVMTALYEHNPSGLVLESLSQTDFDQTRISKNIDVKVAHKIGDAYDFKHDVAVVYTDSPFVLAIFTEKSSYDDISDIADDVYEILK